MESFKYEDLKEPVLIFSSPTILFSDDDKNISSQLCATHALNFLYEILSEEKMAIFYFNLLLTKQKMLDILLFYQSNIMRLYSMINLPLSFNYRNTPLTLAKVVMAKGIIFFYFENTKELPSFTVENETEMLGAIFATEEIINEKSILTEIRCGFLQGKYTDFSICFIDQDGLVFHQFMPVNNEIITNQQLFKFDNLEAIIEKSIIKKLKEFTPYD